ncbi:hypothetical protein PHLH6_18810 [Pseudomonas sp. Seg1]|nr:hypothetical protein PHLH6_18810 [Pseudomonas sp. Seg1]
MPAYPQGDPVVRGFIPDRLRSSRNPEPLILLAHRGEWFWAASQPSGINPLATKALGKPQRSATIASTDSRISAGPL